MDRLSPRSSASAESTWDFRTGAKALVTSSARVLLVAERHADGSLFWTLPGGGVRPDERLEDGLCREIREELRARSVVHDAVDRVFYTHETLQSTFSVYTVYECGLLDEPDPASVEGILDLTWADPSSLPPHTLPQVRRVVRHAIDS